MVLLEKLPHIGGVKQQLIRATLQAFHRNIYEKNPYPRADLTATLQDFVNLTSQYPPLTGGSHSVEGSSGSTYHSHFSSSSSSSSSPSSSSSTPSDSEQQQWYEPQPFKYRPPPGPVIPSSDAFPGISNSQIQQNTIFQLFVQLRPTLFRQTSMAMQSQLGRPLLQKMFCLECFGFTREIILNYLPHLSTMLEEFNETHTSISPCIPPQVGYPLIAFIDFLEELAHDFPEIEQLRGVDSGFYKCLIYQGVGDQSHAVETARGILTNARTRLNESHDAPLLRVILPAFVGCSCLLQYGLVNEAEENFHIIQRYSDGYIIAMQAFKVLRAQRSSLLPPTPRPRSLPQAPPLCPGKVETVEEEEEEEEEEDDGRLREGPGGNMQYCFPPQQCQESQPTQGLFTPEHYFSAAPVSVPLGEDIHHQVQHQFYAEGVDDLPTHYHPPPPQAYYAPQFPVATPNFLPDLDPRLFPQGKWGGAPQPPPPRGHFFPAPASQPVVFAPLFMAQIQGGGAYFPAPEVEVDDEREDQ